MAIKNISTRIQICGRSERCKGGHSAVEQASYIGREKIYCEYDGQTYYPKYSEDLVHSEIMLPEHAPLAYSDPKVLWNAVEMAEKGTTAQLARTFRVELPNEWSYALAVDAMHEYIQSNFVNKGMCAQFAIHDSENKKNGQRNLHCHMLLTMRELDENGKWMSKQKKIYLTDEKGERIPLIDKRTGQQKVDKNNRKQWKCKTVETNDWNNKENSKIWRKDLVDRINAINEQMGITEHIWEHRSFQEQGLDILPQIHLGEKSSALEKAGIATARGDINRKIIAYNEIILQAKASYEQARNILDSAVIKAQEIVKQIKNEITEMIQEAAERNQKRLEFPIVSGKYLRLISNRSEMQNIEQAEVFVYENRLNTFADLQNLKSEKEALYQEISKKREKLSERADYLQKLLDAYKEYEPYIKNHKEQWALKGFARKSYERKHIVELARYDVLRSHIKEMIEETDKKIIPKQWKRELDELKIKFETTKQPYGEIVTTLARIEVLQFNKRNLERMLNNEKSHHEKSMVKNKRDRKETL